MSNSIIRYLTTRRNNPNYETAVREYHKSRTMEINRNGSDIMVTDNAVCSPWALAIKFLKAGYTIQHPEPHTRNRTDGYFRDLFGFVDYRENLVMHGSEYIPTHDMEND